jgi:hypothetical protein
MHATPDFLDLAKKRLAAKHDLELPMSDYRLHKLLDVKQSTLSNWRIGKSHIAPEFADLFARVCEVPEEYVLACIEHERAKSKSVRSIYARIAAKFKPSTLIVLCAAILAVGAGALSPSTSEASTALLTVHDIHYANSRAMAFGASRQPLARS